MAFDHAPGMAGGAMSRGMGELRSALKGIPDALQKKILQRAIQEGTSLIQADAAALVRVRTGETKKFIAMGKAPWASRSRTTVTYCVSAYSRNAHLLEFGVAPHTISARGALRRAAAAYADARSSGDARRAAALAIGGRPVASPVRHPGHRAFPFMRPAFDRNADRCLAVIADHVERGTQAYWDDKWHISRRNSWISKRY